MPVCESDFTKRASLLRSGASLLAVCAFAVSAPAVAQTSAAPATGSQPGSTTGTAGSTQQSNNGQGSGVAQTTESAQSAAGDDTNAIVVTGIRQSLTNSQNIKRNSDTIVDAITAQDIGALPDRSVTEALQRIPGVSINRFGAPSDPDHFSVEGSGVIIRGLTFVRSEFNGRDTFSTGVYGQGINFQDVPAELLGSVEVYKQTTADRIEGGLSGAVNMNLRLPFDNKGFHIGYDLEANYGDFKKKWSPVGSALVSNTWDTGIGRIGVLGAFSYSRLYSRSDGVQISNFQTRDGRYALQSNTSTTLVCRAPLPTSTDQTGFPPNRDAYTATGNGGVLTGRVSGDPCFGTASGGPNGFADFMPLAYAPIGGQFRTQDYDRKREGFAGGFQWQSLDKRALLTAQFLSSKATQRDSEYTFEAGSDLNEYNTFPAGCLPNAAGPIEGGYPNQTNAIIAQCKLNTQGQIVGANGKSYPNYQYDSNGVFEKGYITLPNAGWRGDPGAADPQVGNHAPEGGMQHTLNNRQNSDSNLVQDYSVNFKFSPTAHWDFNADAQYVRAKHDNFSMGIHGSLFADQELDLTGKYPVIVPHKPLTLSYTWAQPSTALASQTDAQYFSDPSHTFWRSAMDHIEHSKGHEWAFKGDAAYNFLDDGSFFKQLKFGARYADRQQDIRNTTYNWGALSEVWAGNGAVFMNQAGQSSVALHTWDNFFRGQTAAPPPANFYSGDLIGGYAQAVALAQAVQAYAAAHGSSTGSSNWVPLAMRAGVVPGTPYLPGEIQDVGQETGAAYAMLRFGRQEPIFGNVRLDGNIGVRVVHDNLSSSGSIGVPSQQTLGITEAFAVRCATPVLPPPPAPQVASLPAACSLGEAGYNQLRSGATGATTPQTAVNKYTYWLPSANFKFGLARDLVFRLAASRDFARPSLGDIRNYLIISGGGAGTYQLTATAGNPYLRPSIADNFDATLEWYFGGNRVGSITIDAFAKNIHNYFYSQITNRSITSGGVTESVLVRGPANYGGTGKIRGVEVAYSQTYDFLPGFLSGFGLSASYTYLTSKGLPNSFLNGGLSVNAPPSGAVGNLPLAQLSKHTINLAPFYEKGPVSIRLAYNWRSKFLLTESDVIFPYDPIFQAASGQLDASAFFTLNAHLKVGVQATNLTNTVTKTMQLFTLGGLTGPRSYFMNDRRYAFILRGSF
jgi:TonB-dependent receptor